MISGTVITRLKPRGILGPDVAFECERFGLKGLDLLVSERTLSSQRQIRKGTTIPYIYHPRAVSALVIEYGGDEGQVT